MTLITWIHVIASLCPQHPSDALSLHQSKNSLYFTYLHLPIMNFCFPCFPHFLHVHRNTPMAKLYCPYWYSFILSPHSQSCSQRNLRNIFLIPIINIHSFTRNILSDFQYILLIYHLLCLLNKYRKIYQN